MPPGPFLRNKRNSQLLIRAIGIIARHIEKWGWRDHPKTPQSSGPVAAHRHDKSTNGKHHHPPRHVAHPIFSWSGHLCPTEYRLALDSSSTEKSRGQQDEKARAAASSRSTEEPWGSPLWECQWGLREASNSFELYCGRPLWGHLKYATPLTMRVFLRQPSTIHLNIRRHFKGPPHLRCDHVRPWGKAVGHFPLFSSLCGFSFLVDTQQLFLCVQRK